MLITWEKHPLHKAGEWRYRDIKIVKVDDVAWARTLTFHHGMHGKSYNFEQIHGGTIERATKAGGKERDVTVRSAKSRSWPRGNESDERSTEQRIIDTARELIAQGLLVHPDIAKKNEETARQLYIERCEKAEKDKDEAFRKKAIETNGSIDAIVEAMKWAQSQ